MQRVACSNVVYWDLPGLLCTLTWIDQQVGGRFVIIKYIEHVMLK